jgi:hypothetical protein
LTLKEFDALSSRYKDTQYRLDYRAALICSVLAEINRDRKRRPKAFKPEDFMPQKPKKMNPKQMDNSLKIITQMMGGDIK